MISLLLSSVDKQDSDRNLTNKQIKIILVIGAPLLVTSAILWGVGVFEPNYKELQVINQEKEIKLSPKGEIIYNMLERKGFNKSTNLLNEGKNLREEIIRVETIFENTDKSCYNVNWYGISGQQVIFKSTINQLFTSLKSEDDGFTEESMTEFVSSPVVVSYIEAFCPHLDNVIQVPNIYDRNRGISPFDSCIGNKVFLEKDYCDLLPNSTKIGI